MKASVSAVTNDSILPWYSWPPILQELLFVIGVFALWLMMFVTLSESPLGQFINYWPIIIVAFVAATIANATAVGGGFVFLPFFSFYYGIAPIESLKLALSTQAFGMSSGALSWKTAAIPWPYVLLACLCGGLGMLVGTFVWLPTGDFIHIAFGWVSLIVGLGLLLECGFTTNNQLNNDRPSRTKLTDISRSKQLAFVGLCVVGGLINAWVSIGIGEFVALWLFLVGGFSIAQAVGSGVVVLAFCSVLGFLFHTGLGGIPWHYLAFTIPGVIVGGRTGAKLAKRLAEKKSIRSDIQLKMLVAIVILLDGVVVLFYAT